MIAVEPSSVMIGQRRPTAAPAFVGSAEHLPLDDQSVDAALAVFTDQHWTDRHRGLSEMLRVARRRVVGLTGARGLALVSGWCVTTSGTCAIH